MSLYGLWRFKDNPTLPSVLNEYGYENFLCYFKTNGMIGNRIHCNIEDGYKTIKFMFPREDDFLHSYTDIYDGETKTWIDDARYKEFFIYSWAHNKADAFEEFLNLVADKVEDIVNVDTVENKINNLINLSNTKTGNTDADLTTAVKSLIGGYGVGGVTDVSTEEEMTSSLATAEIGTIYKYIGESGTYENGAMYLVEEGE